MFSDVAGVQEEGDNFLLHNLFPGYRIALFVVFFNLALYVVGTALIQQAGKTDWHCGTVFALEVISTPSMVVNNFVVQFLWESKQV